MNKKLKLEISEKEEYVSVGIEIYTYEKNDIVTASMEDTQAGNDVNQDDIFD